MSGGRRGDDRGRPRSTIPGRPNIIDTDLDETKVDANVDVPPSRAITAPRRGQLHLQHHARPLVAARLPVGMASAEQIDGFRELRTRLLTMAAAAGLQRFTTLVVPIVAGAGASFVARNLAAAFTLQDHEMAMLVDCNLRHPTQHLALGARSDDGGLFDFLEQPHAAIDQLVRPTAIPGLHLIPAGRPPSRTREYFSSPAMRMLMSALRQEDCYVFLDGPPAKGAPDARILSQLADFVILVLGYGSASSDEIVQTAGLFEPAKFAGVVFNERA